MLKNNLGFSLVEVMVAVGLLGVVSLGAVKITGMLNKNMKTAEVKYDKIEIASDMRQILADPAACLESFSGINASTGTATQIKNEDGTIKFELNKPIGIQRVEIVSLKFNDSFPDTTVVPSAMGDTYLVIEFKLKTGTFGNKKQRLKLKVETDASGNITRCYSLSGGSSLWERTPSDPDAIFYQGSNVGVNTSTPKAALDVNGAVRLGSSTMICDTTTDGAMKYESSLKGLFVCSDGQWRKVLLQGQYVWVNIVAAGDGHSTVCSREGYSVAADQGYGICAAGERRPINGDDAIKINYRFGTYGSGVIGGDLIIGDKCYYASSVKDNDATDTVVAWLCRRF